MAEPMTQDVKPTPLPTEPRPTEVEPVNSAGTPSSPATPGLGLQSKILLFLVVAFSLLALGAGAVSTLTLQNRMRADFETSGQALASLLSTAAADPLRQGDTATLRGLVAEAARAEAVAYAMITDRLGQPRVSSLPQQVPMEIGELGGERAARGGNAEIFIRDAETGAERSILDIAVPLADGQSVARVGMDAQLITDRAARAALPLLVLLGALAVGASLFGYFFARRTVAPIRRLAAVAQRVGDGDLSETAPVTSRDEIGFLTSTFNDSIVRLRELIRSREEDRIREVKTREELQENIGSFLGVARRMAMGDLTLRGEVTEDVLGNVVDSINLIVEQLGELLVGVRQAAGTVNSGAREMISATDDMVSGARAQAQDAQRVRQAVDEVTRSVREVSGNAETSAAVARRTLQVADQGQEAVEATLESMQQIRGEVRSLSARIKSLGDRSLEISEIVDTITAISSQTNLLAFNAAIEASGAGAEGTRFGVVANEVRSLAKDTAGATKRIAALIQAVQEEVQDAVSAMEAGTGQVEEGYRVATSAGDRLREIATVSTESAQLADQISSAAQQQVDGVERVATAVGAIAEVSSRSEQAVGEGRQAAQQLLQLSDELLQRLSQFKVESA